jgi:hypothetical protein
MILLIEFIAALVAGIGLAAFLENMVSRRRPNYGKLSDKRDFDIFLKSIKKKAI